MHFMNKWFGFNIQGCGFQCTATLNTCVMHLVPDTGFHGKYETCIISHEPLPSVKPDFQYQIQDSGVQYIHMFRLRGNMDFIHTGCRFLWHALTCDLSTFFRPAVMDMPWLICANTASMPAGSLAEVDDDDGAAGAAGACAGMDIVYSNGYILSCLMYMYVFILMYMYMNIYMFLSIYMYAYVSMRSYVCTILSSQK